MPFPDEQRIELYGTTAVTEAPFKPGTWKPFGKLPQQLADWYRKIAQIESLLGLVAFDLGLAREESRAFFADGARAMYGQMKAVPAAGDSREIMDGYFALRICGDDAATKKLMTAYAGTSGADPKIARPERWALANVLVAHTLGTPSLADAAKALKGAPAPKQLGPKPVAIFEAMRELGLHVATAKSPDPTKQLAHVAEANAALWRYDDAATYEAYVARRALALAYVAKDRGWKVPERDPHPSMPLDFLRMKPIKVDLDDAKLAAPSADLKKRVAAAKKETLALARGKK